MVFALLALSLAFQTRPAWAACGDTERASPLYRAYEACDRVKLATSPEAAKKALSELTQTGFCQLQESSASPIDAKLCGDPSGFVCASHSNVLDSQCRFSDLDEDNAANAPGYVDAKCRAEDSVAEFTAQAYPDFKSGKCKGLKEGDCRARFRVANAAELSSRERREFYDGDNGTRLQKMRGAYNRVMKKYLAIAAALPEGPKKKTLLERLNHTHLWLDSVSEDQFLGGRDRPDCYNRPPSGPASTQIFNDPEPDKNGNRTVHVCAGAMATIDRMNPYLLMQIFAHEISHSIDPCSLESDLWEHHPIGGLPESDPKRGNPDLPNQFFPGLLSCLYGGAGPGGCEGKPAVSCPSQKELNVPCDTAPEAARKKPQIIAKCYAFVQADPDCSVTRINESFADFMGAEITGRLLQDDAAAGPPLNAADKRDALVATAATYSHLHGGCSEKEVNGHPPSSVRVNRMLMSSEAFRRGVGCGEPPAVMPGERKSCPGF